LSFITYSLAGNDLDTATIFASLQLFNVIETPMQVLPTVFSFLSDGYVAVGRIAKILKADEQPHDLLIHTEQELAIDATGDFAFETADSPIDGPIAIELGKEDVEQTLETPLALDTGQSPLDTATFASTEVRQGPHTPFVIKDISLKIPRGAFVCLLGPIGSGKSALLQGLLGEMRQTRGLVTFGGSVSLVTQSPWIQSASVEDNILFGQKRDGARLQGVVRACALTRDLDLMSDGIRTEIGGMSPRLIEDETMLGSSD
jgi:ABC-type multidrug transport system fused ATPase/permease subunit